MSNLARLARRAPWSLVPPNNSSVWLKSDASGAGAAVSATAAAAATVGLQHWQQQHRALAHQAGSSGEPSAAGPTANSLHTQRFAAAADHAVGLPAGSAASHTEASQSLAKAAAAGASSTGSLSIPNSSSSSSSSSLVQSGYERLARLTQNINRLTGYEAIDKLKGSVGSANQQLQEVKGALAAAKAEYEECLARQSQLHREVTALLQRKSSWVPADVARFTQLYAAEHETEAAVAAAKGRYSHLSDEAEALQLRLVDLIRERYQQEQLWSDNIRRASTWWTWGLMGLHFASFVTVYTVLEPRKRAALQAAVADMMSQHMSRLDGRLMQLVPAGAAAAAAAQGAEDAGDHQQQQQQQQQATVSGGSSKQHQRQQEHEQDPGLQQHVLQELQLVRQQLAQLQQAMPAAVSAAGAAAGAAASAAAVAASHDRWHVPGSSWAAGQLSAAARSAQAMWRHSRQAAEQALGKYTAQRQQPEQQQAEGQQGAAEPKAQQAAAAAAAAQDKSRSDDEPGRPQGHAASAAGDGVSSQDTAQTKASEQQPAAAAAAGKERGLLQQLQGSSSMIQVTRGQLAGVAAAAAAVGAGLTAVVVALLKSGGAAAGGGSSA
uniref:Sensitive to high expression protein 9, mitochondrial n=1 Tax=Tetradesmus obliquus TaxID=3088 RepID=A0A383W3X2_TETOB|eukprot:jgi/Sobl393_1/19878/SZX72171.1